MEFKLLKYPVNTQKTAKSDTKYPNNLMSGDFEGIKTKHIDIDFIYKNRVVFTPQNLIRRKNLTEYATPSRSDMILDAGLCREGCEALYFSRKARKQGNGAYFEECMGTCFSKLKLVDDFMASNGYVESMIESLRNSKRKN
jgi:hypothetical protein